MKWQEKTAEQKKITILVVMLGVAALFISYQFGINPLLTGKSRTAAELRELQDKLAQGEDMATREAAILADLETGKQEISQANELYIAPRENPLAWVTEKIYSVARQVGLEIDSVAEVGNPGSARDRLEKQVRSFTPYSVRVVSQCGYQDVVRMVAALEKSNPYLCVSGISISSQDRTVEKHMASLVVDWPMRTAQETARPSGTGAEKTAPGP